MRFVCHPLLVFVRSFGSWPHPGFEQYLTYEYLPSIDNKLSSLCWDWMDGWIHRERDDIFIISIIEESPSSSTTKVQLLSFSFISSLLLELFFVLFFCLFGYNFSLFRYYQYSSRGPPRNGRTDFQNNNNNNNNGNADTNTDAAVGFERSKILSWT